MVEAAARDNPRLAIGAILCACLALSLGDAMIKQQSAFFVIWQIFLLRSLIALPFLNYFVRLRSCEVSRLPTHLGWTLARSLALVLMWVFYFTALPQIELAIAAAAYYTLPIFIAVFGAIFLGESMTARRWIAVGLGFAGTLLILQPQADDFNYYALLPIASAICYAVAMLLTRSKCRDEKPTVLALWLNLSFVAVGGLTLAILYLWDPAPATIALNPFLLGEWTPMWLPEWRIMAILAAAIVVGSIGAAIAYQNAASAMIATVDFSYVAFAAIWGFLFFAEVPGVAASLGILLIVAGGIVSTRPARTRPA